MFCKTTLLQLFVICDIFNRSTTFIRKLILSVFPQLLFAPLGATLNYTFPQIFTLIFAHRTL